uniref:Integrase catalytic domain-containing protein n=1 Tax=Cacopsylla melanoneura TaxID=428564 RepID=A0A8D8SJN2_9HEMI
MSNKQDLARTTLRTSVTKTSKKIQELVKEDVVDQDALVAQFELLKVRYEELCQKDQEAMENMYQGKTEAKKLQNAESEQDKIDSFAAKFFKCRSMVESALQKGVSETSAESLSDVSESSRRHKYKLPVLKLKEFDGSLNLWLPFWSQFQKIHDDEEMHDVDKIGYLSMSMTPGSPAKRLVDSYPATGEMYKQVVEALKERFGRDDLLIEFYIRELLKLVIQNTGNKKLPLATLYDHIQCHIRNLETLGISSDNCAAILMPLVSSCLPAELLQIWERSSTSRNNIPKDRLVNLLQFLRNEVEGSQKLEMATDFLDVPNKLAIPPKRDRHNVLEESIPTAAGLFSYSDNQGCIFCLAGHRSQDCGVEMTLGERQDVVKQKGVCFACLKSGHRVARCRNRPKCSKCGRGHHAILCEVSKPSNGVDGSKEKSTATLTSTTFNNVLMQTLVVLVCGQGGRTKMSRVLIDTGSQRSYIVSSLAKEMGYKPHDTEKIQHALFGGKVTTAEDYNVYQLKIANTDMSYSCDFQVLEQDTICANIPTVPVGPWIDQLAAKSITLCDVNYPGEIEILIGVDVAARLYTGRIQDLSNGLVAMETELGWTLSGKIPGSHNRDNTVATVVTSMLLKDVSVSDLWSLDVLGITDPLEQKQKFEIDRATEEHFQSTVKVNEENRFEVRLPFTSEHPPLSNNFNLCLKRLESIEKRLKSDEALADYGNVLSSWLEKGIIEKVPLEEIPNPGYYVPHHPVIKVGSTTPIRPVFDASAKMLGSVSLNDCLERGPNLIEKIPSCFIRFRRNKIAISGDITKAFLQISISPSDRDFFRFLWKDQDDIVQYRHCRVVFGASASPFLLESCLKLHLEQTLELCRNQEVSWDLNLLELLSNSFYVDNCLVSVDNQEQANTFMHMASIILMERGFELRGWEYSYESDKIEPSNILGLLWDKVNDTLSINLVSLRSMKFDKITKKVILSAAHRLFDPIGFTCGVALIPKLLLQETWLQKLSWNEEVSEETRVKFLKWWDDVLLLAEVNIPRWILCNSAEDAQYSLHIFSDASGSSYAAVIFLRVETCQTIDLRLIAAKARVAPKSKSTKPMTIPRLELLAASIGTRLYDTTVRDLKLKQVKTTFWTDSSTVLAWVLRQEPWNIFIMNRVKEIRTLSEGCEWKHVPGGMNPADLPSRGSTAKKLIECRWWEGPLWLKESPNSWPVSETKFDEEEINTERKKTVVSSMVNTASKTSDWYYKHFSQYKKNVRMLAWILRFKSNSLQKIEERQKGELTAKEYEAAEHRLFMLLQNESFPNLDNLEQLTPFFEDGLIRLKTKVSNRNDHNDFCHPIVLPGKHLVVERLILDVHIENSHVGVQTLLAILRQRFWIVGGRKVIRSVLNSCVICRRYKTKKLDVIPTPLPENRVKEARVFETTGVDFAGPLYCKDGEGTTKKVWICLFTCAVYRAVRLELVPSLSTQGFVQALRRFCSRNGRPVIMYSDQGSNFVGFDNACKVLDWNSIIAHSSVRRIEWKFNPPSAPWWGGWWERLVGLLKELLRRVLGRCSVDSFELQTILCEAEAAINARPLTYMSSDSSDLCCITPCMFLQDLQEMSVPEGELIPHVDLNRKLKHSQQVRKQLLERFRLEYLGQLQLFAKKKKPHQLKIGDIVFIGDDNVKRVNWPLGRIIEVIKGSDGNIRVVKLRNNNGVLTRPVQRIYPLEVNVPEVDEPAAESSFLSSNLPSGLNLDSDMHPDVSDVNSDRILDLPLNLDLDPQSDVAVVRPETTPVQQSRLNRRGRVIRQPSRFL